MDMHEGKRGHATAGGIKNRTRVGSKGSCAVCVDLQAE